MRCAGCSVRPENLNKTARKLLQGLLLTAVTLLVCGYINRERLERALVATSVYREHIFTAPQRLPGESRWSIFRDYAQFYWDFSGFVVERETT